MSESATADAFVSSPMRDNWYQRCSFLGSSFALITSVSEDGQTNIGPYQLSFPFEVNTGRSWMVISRNTSNTATNVWRTETPGDDRWLPTVVVRRSHADAAAVNQPLSGADSGGGS